jgi:hypothetical protein
MTKYDELMECAIGLPETIKTFFINDINQAYRDEAITNGEYLKLCIEYLKGSGELLNHLIIDGIKDQYFDLCKIAIKSDPGSIKMINYYLFCRDQYLEFISSYPEEFKNINLEKLIEATYFKLCQYITKNHHNQFQYINPEYLSDGTYQKFCIDVVLYQNAKGILQHIKSEYFIKEEFYNDISVYNEICWHAVRLDPEEIPHINTKYLSKGSYDALCKNTAKKHSDKDTKQKNPRQDFLNINLELLFDSEYEDLCWQYMQTNPGEIFPLIEQKYLGHGSYNNLLWYFEDYETSW